MNSDLVSHGLILMIVWMFLYLYGFLVEAIKAYLLEFRYRDLREDTEHERQYLKLLFSIVDSAKRYENTLGPVMIAVAISVASVAWVGGLAMLLSAGLNNMVNPSTWIYLALLLGLSAVLQAAMLKIVPAAVGSRLPMGLIRWATVYVMLMVWLLGPVRGGIKLGVRLLAWMGIVPPAPPAPLDRDFQILATGRRDVVFTPVTEKIASRALELNSISVYDILLPRNQVQLFDLNEPIEANLELARKTGHTRFPLCVGDLDHCEGLIHIKDIFRFRKPLGGLDLRKIMRPILRVGQDEPLDKILQVLLTKRVHMALVEDEFGGILGVLTLERILEELVGEIQDEFDKEDHMIVPLKKDFYKISGLTPLYEVEDQLGVDDLENDDVSSFGGLITHHLGRIPSAGEQIEIGPLQIIVKETDETRVISTTVRVLSLPDFPEI
ncbi:MAG: transporter associated domain-containing protein [Puniceicoccaceae bacterium]